MITIPQNKVEYDCMGAFLQALAYVKRSSDLSMVGWVTEDKLRMVVGLNGFIGGVCQIHVAMEPGYEFTPKAMLEYVFHKVFVELGVKQLLGIVNSHNRKAMVYDKHLGFSEIMRLPGMHDDGGDLVLLGMKPEECRYLDMKKEMAA